MGPVAANDVAIVGLGARTPLGLSPDAAAAAVRGAMSALRLHPFFVDKAGEPMTVACDPVLSPDLDGADRYLQLARTALRQALQPLTGRQIPVQTVPAIVGLPEERPGRSRDLDNVLADDLIATARELGISLRVQTLPSGHSAGLMALENAVARIRSGEIPICLVGGVDSYIQGETLEWLDENRQLMSAANRSGFPPGEAAGFCLLASSSFASSASLEPLAHVATVSRSFEKHQIKTDTICIGEGLSAAIRGACAPLDRARGPVEQSWCDLNGERYRSTEYTYAVLRHWQLFTVAHVAHPADCWGDVGAASGPLFAALAIASWARGYAKGPRSLLWAGSESGYRAAAVLEQVNGRSRVAP